MAHTRSNSLTSVRILGGLHLSFVSPLSQICTFFFTANQRVYRIKPRGATFKLSLGRDFGPNPARIPQGRYLNHRHSRRLTPQPKSNHRRASALDRIHPSLLP